MSKVNLDNIVINFLSQEHYLEDELEQLLNTDSRIFNFLEDSLFSGIWYRDLENPEYEWMSPKFWLTLGYAPQEMTYTSSSWQHLTNTKDRLIEIEKLKQYSINPTGVYDQVIGYKHKNGSTIWLRSQGLVIEDAVGKAQRMVGVHSNISELKQTEEKLRQSEEELSNFLYAASHNIKGPLRTLQAHLDIFEQDYNHQLDAKGQTLIQNSLNSMDRITTLMQDLLFFAELTQRPVNFSLIQTQKLVTDILQSFNVEIQNLHAVVRVDPLPNIVAESNLVRHIFKNLIDNALKYRCRDGYPTIFISSQDKGESWVFQVQDNGIGIKREYQDQIFQIFQRLHVNSEIQGSGLGLGICKRALSYLNGKIWLHSSLGHGSTFYFEIPKGLAS